MSIAANRPIEGARTWANRAFRWWVAELRAAYVDATRHLRSIRGNSFTIEAGEHYWQVRRGQHVLGAIECARITSAALRDIPGLAGSIPGVVTIEIPPERVLSKTITLPATAESRLDRIIAFEMARHFPFAAERVFFSYRVNGRGAATSASGPAPLAVEIAAVPREIVFAIADELASAGFRANAFALVPAPNASPMFLAPDRLIPMLPAAPSQRALRIAVGFLAMAAVISWPVAQQVRLAMMDREIAVLKPAAELALRTRTQFRRAADQEAAISRLRSDRSPLVAVLDLLSREVPDGAWLISLSIGEREVVLDGLAPSAATIALALQRNPGFSNISFRSPIARDAATGLEHFRLGAILAEPKR